MYRTLLGISSHNSNMPKAQFDMGNAGCGLQKRNLPLPRLHLLAQSGLFFLIAS
jgi:hypothetical protein